MGDFDSRSLSIILMIVFFVSLAVLSALDADRKTNAPESIGTVNGEKCELVGIIELVPMYRCEKGK